MRNSIVVALSFAVLVFAADRAAALHEIAYISQTDLKKKCDDNGGSSIRPPTAAIPAERNGAARADTASSDAGQIRKVKSKRNGSDPARRLPSNKRFWTVEEILNNGIGTAGPPAAGPLESSPGSSPQGPSASGTTKPTTPPGGELY